MKHFFIIDEAFLWYSWRHTLHSSVSRGINCRLSVAWKRQHHHLSIHSFVCFALFWLSFYVISPPGPSKWLFEYCSVSFQICVTVYLFIVCTVHLLSGCSCVRVSKETHSSIDLQYPDPCDSLHGRPQTGLWVVKWVEALNCGSTCLQLMWSRKIFCEYSYLCIWHPDYGCYQDRFTSYE